MIDGLLRIFGEVVVDLANSDFDCQKLNKKGERLARLVGNDLVNAKITYEALISITDFVSGMTDRFAADLFRTLTGISHVTAFDAG